jgi:YVTN family beta-propeller protein
MRARLPLALVIGLLLAGVLTVGAWSAGEDARYLNPIETALSADGKSLYVVCEKTDELRVVDIASGKVLKRIDVGHVPTGLSLSPDGKQIYIANSWSDNISVIDADTLAVVRTLPAGFEPISVIADRAGKTLYTANRLSNDISVIDLQSGKEIKRLVAGRGASYLALSPDGKQIYCTHIYPNIGKFRTPPESEITVIDTVTQDVIARKPLHNVAGVFHLANSNDGKLSVVAELRPKNLIPLAHVEHGWAFVDALVIFGDDARQTIQIPIDELDRYFARPFGVAISPDKSKIFVSSGGAGIVTVIDTQRLLSFARSQHQSFANDLSASANYVTARIQVGADPRGVLLSSDGKQLYVANRLDDTIAVIDTDKNELARSIDLGGPQTITNNRRGERLFYNARFAFQGQFSCANCHLDSTFDGMNWDLEPDGFGKDIVDNRSIEDLSGTEPFKWNGGNPNLQTECGPRTEKFFYRSQSYNQQELADLDSYIFSIPLRPNRYRLPDGQLTPAQERGKAIFERTITKAHTRIPESNQCAYCHSGPKYTNRQLADVGSGKATDRSPLIDTPHLPDIAYSAPYLHDGSARSLEEIWTVFNPHDTHGVTNDLTKDELNDLIEYLRTL